MTVLEAHNLTVSYDKQPVLWDIDFEVPEGKLVGIIGPNGSGKTTLLKAAMGLLPADSGYDAAPWAHSRCRLLWHIGQEHRESAVRQQDDADSG